MSIHVERERRLTPGCAHVTHLNNAGASLPTQAVLDAVTGYLLTEAEIGGYEAVEVRAPELDRVYDAATDLIGGAAQNWAFVESATRAWNAAFTALRFRPGDRVLTTTAEYPSNMAGLLRAQEIQGVDVVVVPDDEDGQVDVAALTDLLDDRTRLVSLTHVPTQGGLVNPAVSVGDVLRDSEVLYQVDACQSVGQLPVRITDIGCDVLSFTGRKFLRGPRTTGMVWASDRALAQMGNPAGVDMSGSTWEQPFTVTPTASARRFEPYEVFFAGKVGLALALQQASALGVEAIAERNATLASGLRERLQATPGVILRDKGRQQSAIVTFTVAGQSASAVQGALRAERINVSVATVDSARLDFPDRGLTAVVRASVHYFNTLEELDQLTQAVAAMH